MTKASRNNCRVSLVRYDMFIFRQHFLHAELKDSKVRVFSAGEWAVQPDNGRGLYGETDLIAQAGPFKFMRIPARAEG